MDLSYDEVADALYITLNKGEVNSTEQQSKNVLVDFDRYGKIIGIEIIGLGDDERVTKDISA